MPTYLNSGTVVQTVGSVRVEPGQSVQSTTWLKNLPVGLTQTSDAPVFSNVLFSQKVTGSATVVLPATITDNYRVCLYVASGEVQVKLNSASSTAIMIGTEDKYDVQCMTRVVDNLIIVIVSGTLYINVVAI